MEQTKEKKWHFLRIKNATTIKERITSAIVVLVLSSTLILGVVASISNFLSTYASMEDSMNQVSSIIADRVSWEIRAYKDVVSSMGLSAQLTSDDYSTEEKLAYISSVVSEYGLAGASTIDLNGDSLDGRNYLEREYFNIAVKGEVYFSEPLISKEDGSRSLIAAAPIWQNGVPNSTVIGVVFAAVPAETLNEIMADIEVSARSGAYMLDRNGVTIAHSTPQVAYDQSNTIEEAKTDSSLKKLASMEQAMVDGKDGSGNYTYGGQTKFLSYSPVPQTDGWSVAITAPVFDFMGDTVTSIVLTVVIAIAAIVIGVIVARKLGTDIGTPIHTCVERIEKLVNGDLDSDVEVFDSKDEIGLLGDATKSVVNGINQIIEDIKYLLSNLAEGDFVVESQNEEVYVGGYLAIIQSIRKMVENLDSTMKQINEGADQVAIGSTQLAESAQALAEGATEQAGAVEELTATVENVNELAKDNAESSRQAYEKTKESAEEAKMGQESMQDLVKAMDNISTVSLEIQNIIGAIEDIASQTNLLSLNASIEAARAGEAGAGFAVVANQIGKLASDSAKSAVDTRQLIEKSLQEVRNGNEITQKTVTILNEIIESMSNFAEMSKSSSDASEAQAGMLAEIKSGIEQIAEVVQSNSAAAEESSATSEELSAQSENLKSLVSQFKLK